MLTVVLLVLLGTCLAAPFWGKVTNDSRSESARPAEGWYPATPDALTR